MTHSGGNYNEMSKNHTTDSGLEAMITGSPDPDHPLGRMLSDLREAATGWPTTDKASEHVAAAVQEARLNVSAQASPAVTSPGRRVTRRRTVLNFLATSLIGKILAGSIAFAATGGTLAATGSLPDPIQAAVANTVEVIGLEVPNPSEAEPATEIESFDVEEAVEAHLSDEAAEAKDAVEAVEIEDAAIAELGDAEAADESEHATIGLECAEKATELGKSSDEAKEMKDSDEATKLEESEEAKDLDCSNEAVELKDSDEAEEMKDSDEATEIEGSDEATEVKEADEATEIEGSDEATEVKEADEGTEESEASEAPEAPASGAPATGDTNL